MTELSDLAAYRRLEAEVDGNVITHKGYRSNPRTGERMIRYEETWLRGQYLGHGASGAVFLEQNTKDKDKVRAVKVLLKCRGASGNLDPFDEAVTLSILSRPQNEAFFVNFYGWYETHINLCLVMEYIKHGDLDKHLYERGPLPEVDAKVVIKQLLEGLQVIHQAGLLHRDLKPSNVLIQHMSPWWVKIGDFGISKRLRDKSAITYTGGGTNGFKAPEITFDERTRHTTAVDMWSLGCVTYKALTNKVPFEDDREVSRFRRDADVFLQPLIALDSATDEAKDFLKSLIIIDPQLRAAAGTALTSAWITQPLSAVTTSSSTTMAGVHYSNKPEDQAASAALNSHKEGGKPSVLGKDGKLSSASAAMSLKYARFQDLPPFPSSGLKLSSAGAPIAAAFYHTTRSSAEYTDIPRSRQAGTMPTRSNYQVDPGRKQIETRIPLRHASQVAPVTLRSRALSRSRFSPEQIAAAEARIHQQPGSREEALLRASRSGDSPCVLLLLEQGAAIDTKDIFEKTPLHLAVDDGQYEVVRILLEGGATIDIKDNRWWTPLHSAADSGHQEVVRVLLEGGATVDIKDSGGWTPLHRAAYRGRENVVRILLEGGATVDIQNTEGSTPLHKATIHGHQEVVRMLLEWGATVDIQNISGWTPLHSAAGLGNQAMVRVLLERGANTSLRNRHAQTPYDIAKKEGFRLGFAKNDSYKQIAKLLKP